jgi:iron complex outermembrane receptor protein
MKKLFFAAFAMLPAFLFAQFKISGSVKDKKTNELLPMALVSLLNTNYKTVTDYNGNFMFDNLPAGNYNLEIKILSYQVFNQTITLNADWQQDLFIEQNEGCILPTVDISATRANENSGVVFTQLNKTYLEKQNLGQDLPYLLNQTPSVVVTSDAGTGIGYTAMRIRGSDATRINVTINGIPVNDAESQGTFWVDLPDVISSVDNIQIQRGVGTSTNGAGAFGGSVNIQTDKLNPLPYTNYNVSGGSFNTIKNTLLLGSGLINEKFAFDARLSKINSGGYIDRAFADLASYYFSAAYYGKKSVVKFITFSGREETYQSWYGVHKDSLKNNRTVNIAGMYFDTAGNMQFYKNQIDHYRQDYYQLHLSQRISSKLNFNAALHYTYGAGYYEEYKQAADFSSYNLPNVIIGNDTLTGTDLIRRKWLDNDFYGTTFSLNYNSEKKLGLIIGGAYNIYDGNHFGRIIWAQYASTSTIDSNYYFDNAVKKDFNIFAKANYKITEKLNLFADVQYRAVNYTFLGFDDALNNVTQNAKLGFVNPKLGVNYSMSADANVYVYYGMGNKEPNRDDFTQSTPKSRPKHETLNDFEIGYNHKLKNIAWTVNAYYMQYKNQLVLTGQVNDVGAYIRSNVDDSYRAGIETQLAVRFLNYFNWAANFTYSANKIKSFTEFTDNYDIGGQDSITFTNTDIAFSPAIIASSNLSFSKKGFTASLISKYVGKQFLDNTANASRAIDAFFVTDVLLSYKLQPKFMREIELKLIVNNVLSHQYEANGYTYGYIYGGGRIQESYYYPQAYINFLAGLSFKF